MPKPTMLVPTHAGSSGFAQHILAFNYGVSSLVVKKFIHSMGIELNLKNTNLHIAFNKILFVYFLMVFLRGKSLKYKNTLHLLKLLKLKFVFRKIGENVSSVHCTVDAVE